MKYGSDWVAAVISAARIAAGALAVAALMPGCAYIFLRAPPGFCSRHGGSPIRDFCVVVPRTLWEGERPTTADARWLLTHGVGSIISIQVHDRATLRATSMPPDVTVTVPYFRVRRFNAVRLLSTEDLDDRVALFLAIMSKAPKPVYLHCRLGVDRALVLAGAYRVLIEGLDPAKVIQALRGLHSPWLPAEVRYFQNLTPARRTHILEEAGYWKARVRASAEISCSQGRCRFLGNVGRVAGASSMQSLQAAMSAWFCAAVLCVPSALSFRGGIGGAGHQGQPNVLGVEDGVVSQVAELSDVRGIEREDVGPGVVSAKPIHHLQPVVFRSGVADEKEVVGGMSAKQGFGSLVADR
jgi:hypothetical protein